MTVAQLIEELQKLPQWLTVCAVAEFVDADDVFDEDAEPKICVDVVEVRHQGDHVELLS